MQSPLEQPGLPKPAEDTEAPEAVGVPESTPGMDDNSRTKLPFSHFDLIAQMHLRGTYLGDMVRSSALARDSEGNLETQVIDNLKKAFRVASQMTPHPQLARRFERMLGFLENY